MILKKIKHKYDESVIIYEGTDIHNSVEIGPYSIIYPGTILADNVRIATHTIIGKAPTVGKNQVGLMEVVAKTVIEKDVFIGDQAIIYAGCEVGQGTYLADRAFLRENVRLEKNVVIGTGVVVSFNAYVGHGTKIMTGTNICGNMRIGSNVFIGVHVCSVADNTPHTLSRREDHLGPQVADDVFIGSNVTLLPGVSILNGITVASGSVVTKNLEKENSFYMGSPARFYKYKNK